jgi:hypothetical protein
VEWSRCIWRVVLEKEDVMEVITCESRHATAE